jgi:CHASE2 domain-containing sensor protein
MVGLELHANFAEAFLDDRVFSAVSQHLLDISEVIFGVFAALAFAIIRSFWGKALGLGVLMLAMFSISAIALRELGVFFDAFLPLVGLGIHAFYESYAGSSEHA